MPPIVTSCKLSGFITLADFVLHLHHFLSDVRSDIKC